jgi:hypothetical protein
MSVSIPYLLSRGVSPVNRPPTGVDKKPYPILEKERRRINIERRPRRGDREEKNTPQLTALLGSLIIG